MGHYDSCREAEERLERRASEMRSQGAEVARRLTKIDRVEIRDPARVKTSKEPLKMTAPIEMEIPATTYTLTIPPEELEHALRPHIHSQFKGLPSNHIIKVEPLVGATKGLLGIEISIVCPETN